MDFGQRRSVCRSLYRRDGPAGLWEPVERQGEAISRKEQGELGCEVADDVDPDGERALDWTRERDVEQKPPGGMTPLRAEGRPSERCGSVWFGLHDASKIHHVTAASGVDRKANGQPVVRARLPWDDRPAGERVAPQLFEAARQPLRRQLGQILEHERHVTATPTAWRIPGLRRDPADGGRGTRGAA